MALFVVALAVVLHLATRREGRRSGSCRPRARSSRCWRCWPRRRCSRSRSRARCGSRSRSRSGRSSGSASSRASTWPAVREAAGRHRRLLIGGAVAARPRWPWSRSARRADFVEKIDDVQESSGRLSSPVFPGEALGIWPEGDFRIVRGEVDGALLATGVRRPLRARRRRSRWSAGASGRCSRRSAAAAFVYVLSRPFAQIHVEAKALAVLAPVVMLVTLRWLLGPGERSPRATARASPSAACSRCSRSARPSSPCARRRSASTSASATSRSWPSAIGPDDDVVFLGVDRFAGYYLRGTLTRSPGGYVPAEIGARTSKTWQQGQALDFDTLEPKKLNRRSSRSRPPPAYQSTPPPNWEEVAREGDYVLWRRIGQGAAVRGAAGGGRRPGGDPGACLADRTTRRGEADGPRPTRWSASRTDWAPGFQLEAAGAAPADARGARRATGRSRSSTTRRCR